MTEKGKYTLFILYRGKGETGIIIPLRFVPSGSRVNLGSLTFIGPVGIKKNYKMATLNTSRHERGITQ